MLIREIIDVIEDFAPLSTQESWDNSGLVYGFPEEECSGILIALDCTLDAVHDAVQKGCNLIITHHPLIFHPLRSMRTDLPCSEVQQTLELAIRSSLSIYCSHTPADKAIGGVNHALAARLGLLDPKPFTADGIGLCGNLPKAITADEFTSHVKATLGCGCLRTSDPIQGMISKVAVVGGSGSSAATEAIAAGAQALVTGDVTYHHFVPREGFMIVDAGHFETEVEIVDVFFALISKKFPNFADCILRKRNYTLYGKF